ncbi:MAG: DUF309 domain-containing protein [Candidatus Melainabacteria bacterium]|nr:DUF309 domain-containing protein [Candidatus Melainabacteria bacterium]
MSSLPAELQDRFRKGIEEFNAGLFYDCHETLEEVWKSYQEPDRELIQGIIQIGVAYYHLGRENREGARKLISRGLPRVERFSPSHLGLELAGFVAGVRDDLILLENSPSASLEMFHIPRIPFISRARDC